MTKTARQCLEQERYIKETQKLKCDSTLNMEHFETMTKTARQCLEQERYIKETQQLKSDSTLNMEHFENDLKILLLKIGNWFGDLVQNYKINADIAKDLNNNQFNLDVTNLETKIKTAAVVVEEDDFDDGLSDITEDMTFVCEDD